MRTATTHTSLDCCGCGCETELLQWVEGHRFCLECSTALSKAVSACVERGVELRPGLGPAGSALAGILEARRWICQLVPEVFVPALFARSLPEMRLALVAGVRRIDTPERGVMVSRDESVALDLGMAKLFPFSREGKCTAILASQRLKACLNEDWIVFTTRVLVTGSWENPEEVVAAVTLGEPEEACYFFDTEDRQ